LIAVVVAVGITYLLYRTTDRIRNTDPFISTSDVGSRDVDAIAQGRLLEDYPKDAPVLQPARVLSSQKAPRGERTFWVVTLEASGGEETVFQFYRQKLQQNGWRVGRVIMGGGGSPALNASKGDRRFQVSVSSTTITQIVTTNR
jgi:hypothetical protein